MLPLDMSILARSTLLPSANSPSLMRANRSRFSSTLTLAIRAVPACLGQRAAIFAHLIRRQVVDIRQSLVDQFDRELVQLLEIIGCPAHLAVPLKTQPAHVVLYGLGVFLVFLFRVGVVEAQVAFALIILRQTEVQADGFGMADMQISVRFGRKARDDAAVLAAGQIGIDDRADEVGCGGLRRAAHIGIFSVCVRLTICAVDFTRNHAQLTGRDINCEKVRFIW